MATPDLQRYPRNFRLFKSILFWLEKCLFLKVSSLLLIDKKFASQFRRETAIENEQFKETKTWISNSYLIRQSFKGYCCKTGIAIFARRVSWNCAYSPLYSPLYNLWFPSPIVIHCVYSVQCHSMYTITTIKLLKIWRNVNKRGFKKNGATPLMIIISRLEFYLNEAYCKSSI